MWFKLSKSRQTIFGKVDSPIKPTMYRKPVKDSIPSLPVNTTIPKSLKVSESPPKDDKTSNIKQEFKFGNQIDLDIELIQDPVYRLKLIKLIFKKYCYFNPKYFNFDVKTRMIYTLDQKISIQLNLNFMNIDQRYIFLILSVLQLNLLELVDNKDTEKTLELICEYINLKWKYVSRSRFAFFRKILNGVEVERWTLVLTDEEFTSEIEAQLIRSKIKLTEKGFSKGPDTS